MTELDSSRLTLSRTQHDFGWSAVADDIVGPQLDTIDSIGVQVLHFVLDILRIRNLDRDRLTRVHPTCSAIFHLIKKTTRTINNQHQLGKYNYTK